MSLSFIPNAICIVRILLIVPLVAALFAAEYTVALVLIVVAGLSDGVDGFLARTFDWRSRLGSLLDPAADKLLVVSTFLTLTSLGLVPLGLTAIVVLRDVVIVGGALAYQKMGGKLEGEPVLISKLNTVCQLGFIILTITQAEWGQPGFWWLTLLGALVIFTSLSSGLTYVLIWSKRARRRASVA
ncbi:MAG TPA: CDP-alcohol phosphatidyltransferase family protein [Gammaproteobacteria bacterium]|nr:CDP-alcohol phosphatidyltransferase family protein [Gammaproteobacteria bacterium]